MAQQIAAVNTRNDAIEAAVKAIPAGERGEKGDPGIDGKDGRDGKDGTVGPIGERGEKGDPGSQGAAGERGEKGDVGERGEIGPQGEKGIDGAAGEVGSAGRDGIDGKDGAPGLRGEKGDVGDRGEKGDPGVNGKDAYELAVEKGFHGTELQWLDSLRGKDGENGIAKDGRDGRDGKDGRDAVEINILPAIDHGKAYPSGTYARHKGGLVKTTTTGYDVLVNGIDSETEATLEDGRTIERTTTYTDGSTFTRQHKVAAMIHRGVWVQGDYDRGDCVTRDGSTWHCIVERTQGMPGVALKDWQLIVKRGTHGKDGERGPQGPEGKPGKDRMV